MQDEDGATIEMHSVRIVYRTEIVGGELRDETDESTDRARGARRNEVAAIELVDVGACSVRALAWP